MSTNAPLADGPVRVFLSHSTRDRAFVETLAARMRATGFEPWLCESSIAPASNWVEEIDKGLKASDLVLLIWSPDAAASYATKLEWTSALAREIAVQRLRLGVVMLRDCELPDLLLTRQYIDARRDSDQAIAAVLAWLNGRRDLGRLAGERAPVVLEEYPTDDFFVGRSGYLAELRGAFSQQSPTSFLLHGEPGTGKSTLALRFAWQAQKDFDAVIFQRCGQRPLDAITAELADKLPIDVQTRSPEDQRKAAMAWLRARQSLLVLDDVWSPEVRQLEPGAPCSVLYTSRLASLPWIHGSHTSEVVSFSVEECEVLFHTTLDSDFGRDQVTRHIPALLDFAVRVERLPIAVAVGANLLRQKTASPLDRGALRLRMEQLTDGVRDVPELFRKAIASQPEREQRLLASGAVCVQEGFWLPLAAEIAALTEDEAEDAANRLVHSSLLRVLDRERRRFQLHALLREEVRTEQGSDGIGELQERHAAALEKLFKDWETRWRECRECLEEVVPAVQLLARRNESDREWQLGLQGYLLGKRTGELDVALRIMQQEEVPSRSWEQDKAKWRQQASYGNQAVILQAWGRLEEALALHKKKEAICLELGDKGGLLTSYGNQALILKAWGRLEEALALLNKVESLCVESGSKDNLQTTYGNQALILKAWGRLEEALALHKKKEAICLELGNKDSLQRSYGNQALILQDWGRLEEALALLKKQEAICLELGNKDSLQRSYGNQALILQDWGRLEEALALHKKEEAICLELGNQDGLQISYGNQALILQDWGRLEEAMALHKKEEAIAFELGNKNQVQRSYGNQANILYEWGRLEEALALHKKQEAICLELGNKDGLQRTYCNQAPILVQQGRSREALVLLQKSEAICTELGLRDQVGYCYYNWGLLARAQGNHNTERQKLEQALGIFTELKMPRERDAVQAELNKLGGS